MIKLANAFVLLCGLYAFGKQKSVQAQWTE